MPRYISEEACGGLKAYKCRRNDLSVSHRVVFGPVWGFILNYIPLWVAPNLISVLGLVLNLLSYLLVLYYSPTLTEPLPIGVLLWCCSTMIACHWLDNLDGRQARRTGTAGPLGEIFDHGCDALNITFVFLQLAAALELGTGWSAWGLFVMGGFGVYFAMWEAYHTGAMTLRAFNGPAEALFLSQFLCILSAIRGGGFWHQSAWGLIGFTEPPYGLPALQYNGLVILTAVAGALVSCLQCSWGVYRRVCDARAGNIPKDEIDMAYKHRTSSWVALRNLGPMVAFAVAATLVYATIPAAGFPGRFPRFPHLMVIAIGLNLTFLLSQLIVAHCSCQPFGIPSVRRLSLPFCFLAADAMFSLAPSLSQFLHASPGLAIVPVIPAILPQGMGPSAWVLWRGAALIGVPISVPLAIIAASVVYFLVFVRDYVHFVYYAIQEIATCLGIRVFVITPPKLKGR